MSYVYNGYVTLGYIATNLPQIQISTIIYVDNNSIQHQISDVYLGETKLL